MILFKILQVQYWILVTSDRFSRSKNIPGSLIYNINIYTFFVINYILYTYKDITLKNMFGFLFSFNPFRSFNSVVVKNMISQQS